MSQEVAGSDWMAATAARYNVKLTPFTSGAAAVRVLKADPRRWSVRVIATGGAASIPLIVPAPLPAALPAVALVQSEQEWKYRDWPQAVVGEWWCPGGAGLNCLVVEQLYVGG